MDWELCSQHLISGYIPVFIRDFEKITDNYRQVVGPTVAVMVIHHDLESRMYT